MNAGHRKPVLLGLLTAAIALGVAATAFACVQTVGKLSVTASGTNTNGGTSEAIGNGHHPGAKNVEYCVPPTPGAAASVPQGFGSGRPRVTVTLGPSSLCNPFDAGAIQPGHANTPGDGSYEVMYCDGKVFRDTGSGLVNVNDSDHGSCFFTDGVGDRGVQMGFMTVSGGSGSGVFTIPGGASKNGPNDYAGVSVREAVRAAPHGGPPYVNMAPIQISVL